MRKADAPKALSGIHTPPALARISRSFGQSVLPFRGEKPRLIGSEYHLAKGKGDEQTPRMPPGE